jgi:hypothetical protein
MLRSALALLSMLGLGGHVRQSFDRLLKQALIVVVAVAFIVAAAAFGILAAYRELVTIYPLPEAALLMALALSLLAFLALAVLLLIAPKRKTSWNLVSPGRSPNPIGEGHAQRPDPNWAIPPRTDRFRHRRSGGRR